MSARQLLLLAFLGLAAAEWQKPEWCKKNDCPKFELVRFLCWRLQSVIKAYFSLGPYLIH